MRIAFFSPVNPVPSGISDYSESLLEALATRAEVDLFVDGYAPSAPWIAERLRVVDCRKEDPAPRLDGYDAVLYQMGGTPGHHRYIYELMLRRPGVVVLHDLMYQGFFGDLYLKEGRPEAYRREMVEAYGREGEALAEEIVAGKQVPFETLRRFPLNRKMIHAAQGVIVHSASALAEVRAVEPSRRSRLIPHHDFGWAHWPADFDPELARRAARERLGLPQDAPICSSFGLIVPTKRVEVTLRAFAQVREELPGSRYCLVGEPKYQVLEYIRFLGLEDAVTITGHVPMEVFLAHLHAADVCLNLRYPSQGETSGALLRILALGKPTIVTDHGWFAELPEAACAKVAVDECEDEVVTGFLRELFVNAPYRDQMGRNAHAYVQGQCALERVAEEYLAFLAECQPGRGA